jgi:hypothetical protein
VTPRGAAWSWFSGSAQASLRELAPAYRWDMLSTRASACPASPGLGPIAPRTLFAVQSASESRSNFGDEKIEAHNGQTRALLAGRWDTGSVAAAGAL